MSTNSKDFKDKESGNLGEKIIINRYIEYKRKQFLDLLKSEKTDELKEKIDKMELVISLDVFDENKDMIIEGKRTQVKTYIVVHKDSGFIFTPEHIKKLKEFDLLYFIAKPDVFPNNYGSKIYLVKDPQKLLTRQSTLDPQKECIYIDQEAVVCVGELTDEEISELKKLSTSKYTK